MCDKLSITSRFRNYDVLFIDDFTASLRQTHTNESVIIIDQALLTVYHEQFRAIASEPRCLPVESIEAHKTLDYCQILINTLVEKNIRKNWTLIAVGGGIIQDITAFISSILFRGIDWIFYPTTLLAQADSCIGSKTSINWGKYKNLLGNFYPPAQIYIDTKFIETLPIGEIKSGIGEILHFYLLTGSELLESLVKNYETLLTNPSRLKEYIVESLRIKKNVIEIDEFDRHERNLFNYGHTFGHAIETVSNYRINHGQAVTMGMDIANYLSVHFDYLKQQEFEAIHRILAINMPEFHVPENMLDEYLNALSKDKKNIGENLGCILCSGIGAVRKAQILLDDTLKRLIRSYFAQQKKKL